MWYVVWVKTGQERKVMELCKKMFPETKGENADSKQEVFEDCFLPMREKAWRADGTWTIRKEILFPGYLFFVTENPAGLYMALKTIPEYAKLLGDGRRPIPLQPHEVDFLEKYTNGERVLEMSEADLIGGRLIVTSGPLENYEGRVVHIDRRRREATLELEFFGRCMRVRVGLAVVRKVE